MSIVRFSPTKICEGLGMHFTELPQLLTQFYLSNTQPIHDQAEFCGDIAIKMGGEVVILKPYIPQIGYLRIKRNSCRELALKIDNEAVI